MPPRAAILRLLRLNAPGFRRPVPRRRGLPDPIGTQPTTQLRRLRPPPFNRPHRPLRRRLPEPSNLSPLRVSSNPERAQPKPPPERKRRGTRRLAWALWNLPTASRSLGLALRNLGTALPIRKPPSQSLGGALPSLRPPSPNLHGALRSLIPRWRSPRRALWSLRPPTSSPASPVPSLPSLNLHPPQDSRCLRTGGTSPSLRRRPNLCRRRLPRRRMFLRQPRLLRADRPCPAARRPFETPSPKPRRRASTAVCLPSKRRLKGPLKSFGKARRPTASPPRGVARGFGSPWPPLSSASSTWGPRSTFRTKSPAARPSPA